MVTIERNPTREVRIGNITLGANQPIAVQSMTATKTWDIDATVAQVRDMVAAGADVVRIAVDSKKDAGALVDIRDQADGNLSVDLQENYRLATVVAPYVDNSLQPRPLVSPRDRQAVAGKSEIPCRRSERQ